jgi:hypothetical protein
MMTSAFFMHDSEVGSFVNFVQSDDHVSENPGTTHEYSSTQEKTEYPPGPLSRVVPEYSMPNTGFHESKISTGERFSLG